MEKIEAVLADETNLKIMVFNNDNFRIPPAIVLFKLINEVPEGVERLAVCSLMSSIIRDYAGYTKNQIKCLTYVVDGKTYKSTASIFSK